MRDEARSLFKDRITKSVAFQTHAGQRASDEEILTAVGEAIREFNKGGSTIGLQAAGTTGTVKVELGEGTSS